MLVGRAAASQSGAFNQQLLAKGRQVLDVRDQQAFRRQQARDVSG